ncbi:MAG: alpha/beta fold hydrolase [Planctomycetales bacterium]|nr:alpha/beta fold hydrolase [Planctomycetales bacterium]
MTASLREASPRTLTGLAAIPAAILTAILTAILAANVALAQSPPAVTFARHSLNDAAEFCACAVFDVNRDGRPDIYSGEWWYEAPHWKRHRVRDVEIIRGRFDDYSSLPMDVNQDGWTDVVSVNYRSQSLYWIENPGDQLDKQDWLKHVIDTPGPSETGRLVDIDGDGRLDVLPNGVRYAAWYELTKADAKPTWTRHDLPVELAAHGIGSGDINGDGRLDLVSPNGWLEAPVDRRKGRWLWHPDFKLHRDAGIPIVVTDVDGDGDADLIWGRGHNIGLYWLEQSKSTNGPTQWQLHVIDSEWSQFHSLITADIDGDGALDLVTGKRYLGHEGRDPGEYDPLPILWYTFDRASRAWRRNFISPPDGVGCDLDPKVADLDLDGDLDFVAPSRNGISWFENLRIHSGAPATRSTPAAEEAPAQYADHSQLMKVWRDNGLQNVSTPFDWGLRRRHVLQGMQSAMGPLPGPEHRVPLATRILKRESTEHYERLTLRFRTEANDEVPAYLLIPHGLKGPAPAMLCLHQTTSIGKGEPAGLGGRPTLHYAHELAQRGYVCLAPDYPSFGDYQFDFQAPQATQSGSMKAIWNNLRAVDLLEAQAEVDRDHIGVIGHSLGGHNALFTAAFDQRLRAVVTSCGFTAFHDYYQGKLAGWTSDRYMPRIRDVYGNDPDQVPFDFYEVIAALAPRPVFVNAPLHDSNFDVGGVRKVAAAASNVYRLLDAEARLNVEYPDSAHDFPDATRHRAYEWLDKHLKP